MCKRRHIIFAIWILVSTLIQAQVTSDFTVDKLAGCGTLQAQFSDLSSSSAGTIVQWEWDLDEGVQSTLQNPGRVFVEAVKYTICLTVTDDQGNSNTLCKQDYVEVLALPVVDFSASPTSGCVSLEVQFEDNSIVLNGGIKRMIWGLGGNAGVLDGGPGLSSVSSVYTLPDDYTVSLTIEDQSGCVNTVSKSELIRAGGISQPLVDISEPLGCQLPHATAFTLVSAEPELEYAWDFGNGQSFNGSAPPLQMYTSFGSYVLTLIVSDITSGCRDTFYYQNIVQIGLENLPTVNLGEGCVGTQFVFEDTSSLAAEEYLWDFGDGQTSTKKRIKHDFSLPGCYLVTLTKTTDSCQSTVEISACVNVLQRPEIVLAYDKLATCKLPAEFNLSIGNTPVTNVIWTVGDDPDPIAGTDIFISADTFGIIPFEVRGKYVQGCWISLADTLFAGDLEVNLPGDGFEGCVPISFTIGDSINAQFDIVQRSWTLYTVPIQVSTEDQPVFQIDEAGSYDLELIVTSAEGCVDSVYVPGYLRGGKPPELTFSADILTTCSDTTINFTTVLSSPANMFYWIFGDGGTSEEANPGHVYADTGTFTVILVSQYNGCPATDSIVDYITIYAPIAAFAFDIDCNASEIALEDKSVAADSVFWEISWDGSPYTTSTVRNPLIPIPGAGLFEITQTAWNYSSGCIDYHVDTLRYGSPALDITFSDPVGCAPLVLSVTNTTQNIVSWRWITPGGIPSDVSIPDPDIVYPNAGVFNGMAVEVTDLNGCVYKLDLDQEVVVGQVNPYFGDQAIVSCPGTLISLGDSTISAVPIVKWDWIIGDGLMSLAGRDIVIFIDSVGVFSVTLQVEDSLGCMSEITLDSAIVISDRKLSFTSDSLTCIGVDMSFEVLLPVANYTYEWNFGNGDIASGPLVTYAFQNQGSFDVCVEIANATGCDSTVCRKVDVISVNADFAFDTAFADCPPLIVNFQSLSTQANYFKWDFGDESGTSPLESPSHVYTSPGIFDVTLIAGFNAQCTDTLTLDSLIRLEGPAGEFSFETDGFCVPVTATFIGTSVDLYDYIWDFGNGALDTTTARVLMDSSVYTYLETGKYLPRLILIDNEFCKRTLTTQDTIFVQDVITAELFAPDVACIEDSVSLEAILNDTVSAGVLWSSDYLFNCDTCLNVRLLPDTSFTAYISVFHQNGCVFEDSISVDVVERPNITLIQNDIAVCYHDSAFIQLMTNRPGTFIWNLDDTQANCSDCPSPVVFPGIEGVFVVDFLDQYGCTDRDSVMIDVLDAQTNFISGEASICVGDTAQLSVIDVTMPFWTGTTFIDCDSCQTVNIFPPISSTIFVQATGANGCVAHDTTRVTVVQDDAVNAGEDVTICSGEIVFLDGKVSEGEGAWLPNPFITDPTGLEIETAPDITSLYILELTAGQCVFRDSLTITVEYNAEVFAVGDTICPGDTAVLMASGDIESYAWFNSKWEMLKSDTIGEFRIAPIVSGVYHVIGFKSVCIPDTADAYVSRYDDIDYVISGDNIAYPGEVVDLPLDLDKPELYDFDWAPAESLSCSNCPSPITVIDSSIQYNVTITEIETNCIVFDSVMYRVPNQCSDQYVYVPNVFSPNDDGANDELRIYSKKFTELISFGIYDRWGSVVFSTQDLEIPWDGRVNGEDAPAGVYVYALRLLCPIDNSVVGYTGDITLLR
jgi:gliding motility-associated-like protein